MSINITSPPSEPQRKSCGWLLAAGLSGALVFGLPSSTYAQETTTTAQQQQDTSQASRPESTSTDSTKWGYKVDRNPSEQNPPGYRAMERPAAVSDSGAAADSSAPGDATSRVNQMKQPGDSTKQAAAKKPSTGKKHAKNKTGQQAVRDSSSQDSTKWGYKVDRNPQNQNPPGYRGMERPAGLDSAQQKSRSQGARSGQNGSPAVNQDTMQSGNRDTMQSTKRDSMQSSNQDSTPSPERANTGRASDSTSTVRMGQDSTGDSTRFGVNAQEQSSNTRQSSAGDSLESRGRDSVDVVHRQRQVAPGMGHEPPPYPADSERAWVQEHPGSDSVSLRSGDSSSATNQSGQ